ncbi:hypothetical protein AN958_00555, partial [Leucoagaricus sp. SymC.cos]
SVDTLTDEDLYNLIQGRSDDAAIRAPNESNPLIADTVWRISHDAVAKLTHSPTEAFIMTHISSHTCIPIPKVRRVLPARTSNPDSKATWIIMDYISGDTLETVWPRMSWWKRFYVIWVTRRYIRELQQVPIPNRDSPGPFDVLGQSYMCHGYYFTEDSAGPFRTYLDMATWFDQRRFDTMAGIHDSLGFLPHPPIPKFDISHPLVLCHMDLHMRNFVVDSHGKLWIIDWENAGAFPPWLEYAQMTVWANAARPEARPPKLWTFFARFMIGDYRRYKTDYLDRLEWAWTRRGLFDHFPIDYFSDLGITVD